MNVRALLADVYELDLKSRAVWPTARRPAVDLPYDTLVVAAGATHSYSATTTSPSSPPE